MPGMGYHVQQSASGNHDKKHSDVAGLKRAEVKACMGYQSDCFPAMMRAGAIANPILPLLASDSVTYASSDEVRSAAQAAAGRTMTPQGVQELCRAGLKIGFGAGPLIASKSVALTGVQVTDSLFHEEEAPLSRRLLRSGGERARACCRSRALSCGDHGRNKSRSRDRRGGLDRSTSDIRSPAGPFDAIPRIAARLFAPVATILGVIVSSISYSKRSAHQNFGPTIMLPSMAL
jgi:hypothetical protein